MQRASKLLSCSMTLAPSPSYTITTLSHGDEYRATFSAIASCIKGNFKVLPGVAEAAKAGWGGHRGGDDSKRVDCWLSDLMDMITSSQLQLASLPQPQLSSSSSSSTSTQQTVTVQELASPAQAHLQIHHSSWWGRGMEQAAAAGEAGVGRLCMPLRAMLLLCSYS